MQTLSVSSGLCNAGESLINIIYTLCGIGRREFMNTRNEEQLFDREKTNDVMPRIVSGGPTPRGLSVNNRMSAAAESVFGEGTCHSRLRQRRRGGRRAGGPANQRRSQHSRARTRK